MNCNGTIYVKHGNETTTEELPKQTYQHEEHSEHKKQEQDEPKIEKTAEPLDHYTFLALIEINFSDGSRKNCTGAIIQRKKFNTFIHDNVVITAAHCFEKEHLDSQQLELTGSFVIIGTKQMFDAGYEQYLPIEQVLIHPDYKGWEVDIALVYTFAGMRSDKPGNIIPLAEGNSYTTLNSNVTVLNWNQIKKINSVKSIKPDLDTSCSKSSEEKDTYFHRGITKPIYSQTNDWSTEEDTKSSASKAGQTYVRSSLV